MGKMSQPAPSFGSAERPARRPLKSIGPGKDALGSTLKRLRSGRGWTLDELCRRSGVSRSTLSKIENSQISPTYDILQNVATGLEIDLVELFSQPKEHSPLGRRAVTGVNAGQFHDAKTYQYEMLAPDLSQKAILPFKAAIKARSLEEFDGWVRHEGEEFLLVLSGSILLYTEYYEPVELRVGESAYFDSMMGHACVSTSEEDAQVVWVCTSARSGLLPTSPNVLIRQKPDLEGQSGE